jgi:hypothetical protein
VNIKPGDKVWLVKYALVRGPKLCEVESPVTYYSGTYVHLVGDELASFKVGRDVATTWKEAVELMESMRAKKLKSLRWEIEKLEAMQFVKPEGE